MLKLAKIRTKPNGQKYPIQDQKSPFKRLPPYSPDQLLSVYRKSQTPEDRLKYQRAAQSKVNRTQDPEEKAQWQATLDKMKKDQLAREKAAETLSTLEDNHLMPEGIAAVEMSGKSLPEKFVHEEMLIVKSNIKNLPKAAKIASTL